MRSGREMIRLISLSAVVVMLPVVDVSAGVAQEFTNRAQWEAAVGPFTTIDFTGFPLNTFITDQFTDQGVLFTDNADVVFFSPAGFPNDDWGLQGLGTISMDFAQPQGYIGIDHPGRLQIELYLNDSLMYTSSVFLQGGAGLFAGIVFPSLFDKAIISDPFDADLEAFIDDVHFGVPAHGAIGLLLIGGLMPHRRRR